MLDIPALHESLDGVRAWIAEWRVWVARIDGRLVAAARARVERRESGEPVWSIGRVMVAPDLQGRGFGRGVLEFAEGAAPAEATTYELWTGARSTSNLRFYRKAGYRQSRRLEDQGLVVLTKRTSRSGR
ncbi:GNAT family N-acetyltransferase [Nocardioides alcanivorans]|uniref:GNAT family N-acetyltransferase n=1 Tax=Nocardioides alcanivorans TaxID=2897352 RepID=UPI001F27E937|nr:GNAT family N-acetyltransferase [Nocardioides alcanivorans]